MQPMQSMLACGARFTKTNGAERQRLRILKSTSTAPKTEKLRQADQLKRLRKKKIYDKRYES